MLGESEKRAADLAVSRFGVSRERLQRVVDSLLAANDRQMHLLDALVENRLITDAQAVEMRLVLGNTLLDPNPPRKSGKDIFADATLPPDDTTAVGDSDVTRADLNWLGEFKILRRIGEGGMGSVYLAYQESEKRQVAIKVLSSQQAGNQSAIDRFYREAKSGALLRHPNIVRNFAAGQDQASGRHYLVMEYVDGPSLDTLLEKHGRLSVADTIYIVLDIARGLEHVHSRNIVHRDVKPGNILISQSGLAKLSDLGLAKRTDEASHLTAARQGFGTPYYMPYEQAVNAKAADARSDIYALGATLYHLVMGEVPFTGNSPVEIVEKKNVGAYTPACVADPELPRILDTLLARMLAREPRHRYQTVSELIVDLERSQLAAQVPSFIDPERALHDPVVQQRITSSMQVTAMQVQSSEDTPTEPQYWYARYRDANGHWRKAKATIHHIIKRCRDGRLPMSIEVSPYANGDFRPLQAYTEFQALADAGSAQSKSANAKPAAPSLPGSEVATSSSSNKVWFWLAGAAAVVIVGVVIVTLLLLWR